MLYYASLSKLLVCLFAYSAVTSGSSCLEQLYAYGPSTPGPLPCSIRHFERLDRSSLGLKDESTKFYRLTPSALHSNTLQAPTPTVSHDSLASSLLTERTTVQLLRSAGITPPVLDGTF